ncbi:hypothetical protein K488DRAFT_71585 [Vararia minispora EC-137]|uniref:Uncharacterized protein n=1 Tax=Vararia minispora EC-137 TaxID=1314806 RepID=A0ACB8QIQ1_9AGAM|nr:hypothetical protein K488DRAFT_71585 [Vararia minispora EC-137]
MPSKVLAVCVNSLLCEQEAQGVRQYGHIIDQSESKPIAADGVVNLEVEPNLLRLGVTPQGSQTPSKDGPSASNTLIRRTEVVKYHRRALARGYRREIIFDEKHNTEVARPRRVVCSVSAVGMLSEF